jgi:Tfp pilus assembly protein FimT
MFARLQTRTGLTLMELMTIVVLIGLVAGMAAPRFMKAAERLRLRSADRDITSTFRLARSKAISEKAPFGVYYDPERKVITLFKDIVNPSSYVYEDGDEVVKVDTLPSGFTSISSTSDDNVVVYLPNGAANASTKFWVRANTSSGVLIYEHDILAATGRIRSQEMRF